MEVFEKSKTVLNNAGMMRAKLDELEDQFKSLQSLTKMRQVVLDDYIFFHQIMQIFFHQIMQV